MDSSFPAELLPRLQRDAMERLGLPALPPMRLLKTMSNPYSAVHILEFDGASGTQRLFLKQPKSPTRGHPKLQARLLAEFQIMDSVHTLQAAHEQYRVAKPIGVYPEYPAIATLDAGKQTLRGLYARLARRWIPRAPRRNMVRYVRQCGLWLKDFQQRTDAGPGPFDAAGMLHYLQPRFEQLQARGLLTPPASERLIRAVHALCERDDMAGHRTTGRHNDFAGHNILAEGDRVCIIDFSMYDTGSYAHDPVNFWIEFEMLKLDPTYDRDFLTLLQDEFLDAYGLLRPGDTAFKLARCQYTVTRLLTVAASSPSWWPRSPYKRAVHATSRQWLDSLTNS